MINAFLKILLDGGVVLGPWGPGVKPAYFLFSLRFNFLISMVNGLRLPLAVLPGWLGFSGRGARRGTPGRRLAEYVFDEFNEFGEFGENDKFVNSKSCKLIRFCSCLVKKVWERSALILSE